MLSPDSVILPQEVDESTKLSRRKSRVAIASSVVMITMYFVFMSMFAFAKPTLGTILAPGLSLCILLGAGVIVGSFVLCLVYVVWADRFDDPAVRGIMS
ncbi:DUF485 domain-containing protein [Methylobacterium planeticum]|uniref:DUF485 domain-containing protein n=1 Tax=Methylobacterium planeticum TaxID=2615211 RepID=A0A6N6MF01_9HYPH|nr:DUF485 domain-containing protein [Methylobacterium planeticum]KAB1067914.1 DUF485 domain-containing protein [Methylobacterium planeticum]